MFNGIKIYIHPEGIIKARKKILETQFVKNGGVLASTTNEENLNYILVDDDLKIAKIRTKFRQNFEKLKSKNIKFVWTRWLSNCVKEKSLKHTKNDEINFEEIFDEIDKVSEIPEIEEKSKIPEISAVEKQKSPPDDFPREKKFKNDQDIYEMTTESSSSSSEDEKPKNEKKIFPHRRGFVCERSSAETNSPVNHNKAITDKLQILADGYKSTKDRWRTYGYEKAINILKHYPKAVETREEVKKLRGIGDRLAEKILEIVESGELRKADAFTSNEKIQAVNIFNNIWGVGPTVAEQWYMQGLRTLDDVRTKAKLTHQQAIGLKYYDEFLQRIPRDEADQIVEIVISATNAINPNLLCVACGSYRRGRSSCGDLDFLITHPDGHSHEGVLGVLVKNLTDSGFLTDDLVESSVDGNHKKYMGVCQLAGDDKMHRRIDIIVVPYDEHATALVYFTGSAYFVRSIYAKAKSMGLRLNAHCLRGGVMRQHGEKLNDGYRIETPTEESVFEKVGIPYRTPSERDHPS